jgi:hypothetical protein
MEIWAGLMELQHSRLCFFFFFSLLVLLNGEQKKKKTVLTSCAKGRALVTHK